MGSRFCSLLLGNLEGSFSPQKEIGFNAVILTDSLLALWFDANSRKVHLKTLQGEVVLANCASPRGCGKCLRSFLVVVG